MIDASRTRCDRDTESAERHALLAAFAPFQGSSPRCSIVQLTSTGLAYLTTLAVVYAAFPVSGWLVLTLSPLAAGFMIRLFIIQHDCGHGSYFHSRHANKIAGRLCSLATFTPYDNWRRQHARRVAACAGLCSLGRDEWPNGAVSAHSIYDATVTSTDMS
jgi:fatty acid desaturase